MTSVLSPGARRVLCWLTARLCPTLTLAASLVFRIFSRHNLGSIFISCGSGPCRVLMRGSSPPCCWSSPHASSCSEAFVILVGLCGIGLLLFGYDLRGIHKDCDGQRNLVMWGHESSMEYFFPRGPRFSNPGGPLRPSMDGPMQRGGGETYVTVR